MARAEQSGSSALSRRQLGAMLALPVSACTTPQRMSAVPGPLTTQAEAIVPGVRFFPDRDPAPFERLALAALERERLWLQQSRYTGSLPPTTMLAVSGGGGDGAFGAGLMCGWSEAGDRPVFRLVTGISTGALIAPFVFAGPRWDPVLRQTYTETSDADIFRKRSLMAAIFDDALASTTPMTDLAERFITPALLGDIAAEHAKGRLLLVGTTNLDAREPVYWDMGSIAGQGSDEALALFRSICLASAAIPGAFPPVMIDVTADGRRFQEMHVDGGATRQAFMYPQTLRVKEIAAREGLERSRKLYILRNARLDPDWASVDRRTLSIVGRAVTSLIQTQGEGDLIRMYLTCLRDGVDYNLAYIPRSFDRQRRSEFDPDYMRPLFEIGRSMAAQGFAWAKEAPGYGPGPGA